MYFFFLLIEKEGKLWNKFMEIVKELRFNYILKFIFREVYWSKGYRNWNLFISWVGI